MAEDCFAMQSTNPARTGPGRRLLLFVAAGVALAGLAGGAVWVIVQLADQLGAPGIAGATGSGACIQADAVVVQVEFGDGHSMQACTRDRPACANQTITSQNGATQSSVIQFTLGNQLRSATGRYIFFVRFNGAVPTDMSEQVLRIDPAGGFPKGPDTPPPAQSTPALAIVQLTPRDSSNAGYTPSSGSITVSAAGGVVSGSIDAGFGQTTGSGPDHLTGRFECTGPGR